MPDLPTTQNISRLVRKRRFITVLRPLLLISAGYVLTYLTLFAVESLGVIEIPTRAWGIGLGIAFIGQIMMALLALFFGSQFRDWKVLGIGESLIAILQFGLLTWWVPESAPVLMIAWVVNLSHVASFLGWRKAIGAALVMTAVFTFSMLGREAWQTAALVIFIAAQLYTIASHGALHYRLWKKELQGRELIAGAPVGLYRTDAEGECLYVNQRWQTITGINLKEAQGEGWTQFLHPEDREEVAAKWRVAVEESRPFQAKYRFTRRDGRVTWVLGQASPVINHRRRIQEWIGSITDISERVLAEEKAEEANRVKTDFLANMSHEIRTPIAGIVGASELLSKQKISDGARTFVDVITTSAGSLLRLIDGLLDFSKIEAGKLAFEALDFSIPETVEAVIHMLHARAMAKGIELRSEIAVDVPLEVHGDPLRLHQVLVNLVSNAIKFTTEGEVELIVRLDQIDPGQHAAPPKTDHRLVFEIRDTGIGIDKAAIDQLFEPFVQADTSTSRRFGGSGLGLSICKRIIDQIGGVIEVRSRLGEGTTFTVTFPFAAVTGEGGGDTDKLPRRSVILRRRSDFHILLAEDNSVNKMIAMAQLDDLGYRVTAVGNGLEVLEALEDQTFDLILMDCQMPELDGYETTRRIRQLGRESAHLPIIAVTAHAVAGDRQRSLDAGMDDYISKPYESHLLEKTMNRWLWIDDTTGESRDEESPAQGHTDD